jgi:hypothetical protein
LVSAEQAVRQKGPWVQPKGAWRNYSDDSESCQSKAPVKRATGCYKNRVQRADGLVVMQLSGPESRCTLDVPSDELSYESGVFVELVEVEIPQIVVADSVGKHVIDGQQDLMGYRY